MKVTANGKTVAELLLGNFYKIPRFQRPYSWDSANVEDFWNDVIASGNDYFIGAMVVFPDGGTLGLIDGQQRLTTITLLLSAIRNEIISLDGTKEARGVQTMVSRMDSYGDMRFVLQSETSYPFLQASIQSWPDEALPVGTASDEERNIEKAFGMLVSRVKDRIKRVDDDQDASPEDKIAAKLRMLTELRDKVSRLTLVLVEVDNEDDATQIFQTLNSRGKDLDVGDLVKSHILSLIKSKNKSLDQARDSWRGILKSFADSSVDLSMDRFLLHSWLSRREYVGEKQLFRAVKNYVKPANAQEYLDNLVGDAKIYREIQEYGYRTWNKSQVPVKESLRALMLFRLRQPLPMVLSLVRAYDQKVIKLATLIKGLHAIEAYHFIATAVTNQPSSGGVSKMYAAAARGVLNSASPSDCQKVIGELADKLRGRLPSYAEFEASFMELRSSKKYAQHGQLVRYTLTRLHAHSLPKPAVNPVDFESLTIEHLAPQGSTKSGVTDSEAAQIGNLILVSEEMNNRLGDKTFAVKQSLLRGHPVESEILKAKAWTQTEITARSKRLAATAYQVVWSF